MTANKLYSICQMSLSLYIINAICHYSINTINQYVIIRSIYNLYIQLIRYIQNVMCSIQNVVCNVIQCQNVMCKIKNVVCKSERQIASNVHKKLGAQIIFQNFQLPLKVAYYV